jgi:serine/threonine-protein kinase
MLELPIEEGQLVAGKYRIERVIGSGAMGVVVAAWHVELAQRVAVKFVRPEAMELRDAEERFRREARAAARIRSEHVGRVMDVGALDGGIRYMVMEFLEGQDLADELLRRGPLPVAEAVGYMLEAIEALAEAHNAGIIHRDLKPANLFLARRADGTRIVKILDFGVSKATGTRPGDMALTQQAAMIGSPLYMSPEQMRSARDVDARADIWSLGIILFELLSGRPPYLGDSIPELVTAMMVAPRSLRAVRRDVPEALERAVLRCLERDPNRRFADVGALAAALVEFAPESRLHALRAQRVLGGAPLPNLDLQAETLPTSIPTGRRTIAAWGESQFPVERRSLKRPLLIGGGVVLAAAFVAIGYIQASRSSAENSFAAPAASLPAVAAPRASLEPPRTLEALPEPPRAPMVSAPSATPSAVASAAPKSMPRAAAKPVVVHQKPAEKAASSARPAPKDDFPDFGGRR